MDSSVDESDNNKTKRFQVVKRSDASADATETLPEGRSRKLERKLTSVENLTSKNYLPQILEQDTNSRKSSFSDKEGSVHSYLGLVTSTQDARQDATEMPGGCLPDWYARKESNESEFSRKESNESTRSRRSGAYAMDPSKLVVKVT